MKNNESYEVTPNIEPKWTDSIEDKKGNVWKLCGCKFGKITEDKGKLEPNKKYLLLDGFEDILVRVVIIPNKHPIKLKIGDRAVEIKKNEMFKGKFSEK